MPAPSAITAAPTYHRHRPEQTALYAIVAEHYPRFFLGAISTFLIHHAGLTVSSGARTGAVTLIQRFGSALNLNPHLHMLFLDGAYAFRGKRPTFHRARRPNDQELTRLLDTLSRRIVRVLEGRGLLIADPEHPCLDLVPDSSLDHLQAASVTYRIAIAIETCPHCGGKLRVIASIEEPLLIAQILGHIRRRETLIECTPRAPPEPLPLLKRT